MIANYRENGYISHAAPTPIRMKSRNDLTAYLMRSEAVRRVRHVSAIETSAANDTIAQKWLIVVPATKIPLSIQVLRPDAISYASNTAIKFTTPAAAMKRVP